MSRGRRAFLVAFIAGFLTTGIPAAQAHHGTSSYVVNADNIHQYILMRTHNTGLQVWKGLEPGQNSGAGAWGIDVPRHSKIRYESIVSGTVYWSHCGEYYIVQGNTWKGEPYLPIPMGRPIRILDQIFVTTC